MKFKTYTLQDLVIIKYGKNQSKVLSDKGSVPLYGTGGLMGYVDRALYDKPSILIGRKGTISKVKYVDHPFWTVDTLFYTEINEEIVAPKYLYYLMLPRDFSIYDEGTTIPSLRTETLYRIEFSLPPLPTQRKIAAILSALDDKIETNNAICRNLEEQLRTIYKEISQRSAWRKVSIGEIADKVAMGPFGSNIKVESFVETGVPIISGNHLRRMFLEEEPFNFITEEHANKLKNSLVHAGDIVFTHAGNIGQVSLIPDDGAYNQYIISQRQFYLRCNKQKAIPLYVLLFFHSRLGQWELLSYANQTGVPSISQPASNLKKITLPLPPITEQQKWAEVALPMMKKTAGLQTENKRLSSLRDTLLPRLMSGEPDVSSLNL